MTCNSAVKAHYLARFTGKIMSPTMKNCIGGGFEMNIPFLLNGIKYLDPSKFNNFFLLEDSVMTD